MSTPRASLWVPFGVVAGVLLTTGSCLVAWWLWPRPEPTPGSEKRWVAVLPVAEGGPADAQPTGASATPPVPTERKSSPTTSPKTAIPAPPAERDARGFVVHTLDKRIDRRTADELEKELLAAREALEGGTGPSPTTQMRLLAARQFDAGQPYPGSVVAAVGRPDLAGLPFRLGMDAAQSSDRAQAMNALSTQLRQAVQQCVPKGTDPRPDTDKLFATLIGKGKKGLFEREATAWAAPEAVPCIQQMLLAENREVRRMSCELLSRLDVPEAAEALVRCAVFDTDAGNRAAAVDALRGRPRAEVAARLLNYVRYPWPRATEHAAEALVALGYQETVPALATAYTLPAPGAPFTVRLSGKGSGLYKREVVRVNHLRNCSLCHPPSLADTDLVRGAEPDPSQPLGGPTNYHSGSAFVSAATTYLKQDFSQVQPVASPGKWPAYQRFDYFVAVSPVKESAATADTGYLAAVRFALHELSGHDPDRPDDLTWLRRQPGLKLDAPVAEGRAEVAQLLALQKDPLSLVALKNLEFSRPLLAQQPEEILKVVNAVVKTFGTADARLALIAYLEPLIQKGEPTNREKAARLLAVALDAPDVELASGMKVAAVASSRADPHLPKSDAPTSITPAEVKIVADSGRPLLLGSEKFFVAAAGTSADLRAKWVKEGELRVLTADTAVTVVGRDAEFCLVTLDGKKWYVEAKRVPADKR